MATGAGDYGHGAGVGATAIPSVILNTGHAMPVLGFGTGSPSKPADLADIIVHAVRLGYRHLDTASMYRTEPTVGAAVAESVRVGAVRSHADLFVTSKLWISDARPGRVVPALRDSLARLGLAYLDLFLVHLPVAATTGGVPVDKGTLVEFDMEGVWRGMEESGAGDLVIREGRVCPDRQIGGGGGCVSSGEEEERIGTSLARGALCL